MSALTGLTENCMVFQSRLKQFLWEAPMFSAPVGTQTQKTDWMLCKCTFNVNTVSSQHPGTQSGKQCFGLPLELLHFLHFCCMEGVSFPVFH